MKEVKRKTVFPLPSKWRHGVRRWNRCGVEPEGGCECTSESLCMVEDEEAPPTPTHAALNIPTQTQLSVSAHCCYMLIKPSGGLQAAGKPVEPTWNLFFLFHF